MRPVGNYKIEEYINDPKISKRLKRLNTRIINRLRLMNTIGLSVDEVNKHTNIIALFSQDGNSFFTAHPNYFIENIGQCSKRLKNRLLPLFCYEARRSDLLPGFFHHLGIKACIYCNTQFTLTFQKNGSDSITAKHEADHFHSKDLYPYLAVSLYNLYPSCGPCNNTKSNNPVNFDLYSNEEIESLVRFRLDSKSLVDFFIDFDPNKLNFTIEGNEDFISKFHLREIYATQKDIAEELAFRSLSYNPVYKEVLNSFGISDEEIKRYIVGNYINDDEIFKRPLSKFMADIARDLKII